MKKVFLHSPIRYFVSVIIVVTIIILYRIFNKADIGTSKSDLLIAYSNSLFLGGVLLISIGLLSLVDYNGGYDIFRFMFVRKNPDGTKQTLRDYSETRKEKIKNKKYYFVPYILVGALAIIVSLLL